MSRKLLHRLFGLLAIVPLLLTIAPAMAQDGDVVYAGQTTTLSVVEVAGVTYTWELYNDVTGINLAVVPGNCPPEEAIFVGGVNTGASVEVQWLAPGTYFYKVTAEDGCSNNIKLGKIEIEQAMPVAFFEDPEPICIGDPGELTVVLTGVGPWEIEYTDGTNIYAIENIPVSPYTIPVSPDVTTIYTILSVTDANGVRNDEASEPVTLEVLPRPITSPIRRYVP